MSTATSALDSIDHVAISVSDIAQSVSWYRDRFACEITYQDSTWAMLKFANVKLALVVAEQHPPHIGLYTPRASEFGELTTHRDGSQSIYVKDPAGNSIELLEPGER